MAPKPNESSPYQVTTVSSNKEHSKVKGYDETIYFFRHLNQK